MNAPRTRVQRRPVHGVLLLDKPYGLSSNDALQKAKWLLRAEKAGHTGTLDPLATGVLPLCFGAATKFSQLHLDADKTYEAIAVLGVQTSTGDLEGEVVAEKPVNLTPEQLQQVQLKFTGPIDQIPPMYSALKKDGKALYDYARAGIEVEREARHIVIHKLALEEIAPVNAQRRLKMTVTCSKGTYIRALAEDLGTALNLPAHVKTLRRTQAGPFGLTNAVTLAQLEAAVDTGSEDSLDALLLPVDDSLTHLPSVLLSEAATFYLRKGQTVVVPNGPQSGITIYRTRVCSKFSINWRLWTKAQTV